MHAERRRFSGATFLALLAAAACSSADSAGVGGNPPAARDLRVEATGPTSTRLTWRRVEGVPVSAYVIERRMNFDGGFRAVATILPTGVERLSHFDTGLEPATYYGYRVLAQTSLGGVSPPSTVGGARTSPPPTLVLAVATETATEDAADADGYLATIRGPRDTLTAPVALNGERRFTPLRPGAYTVQLQGLAPNCDFKSGDAVKVANIVDTGLATEATLRYEVSCRDPGKGSLVIRYEQEGDTTDDNGVRISITGLLTPKPGDTTSVYARTDVVRTRIATSRYDNLRPGQYEVAIDDVSPLCSVSGQRRRNVAVGALTLDTVRFSAVCQRPVVTDTAGKPLLFENQWSTSAATLGSRVSLTMTLDATARASRLIGGVQLDLSYLASVVRFDSATRGDFGIFTRNGSQAGLVILATADPDGLSGRMVVGRVWFTVIGQTGASVRTGTTLINVPSLSPPGQYRDSVAVREATLTVGQFSGQNQPPIARANGPYSGNAGVAVQLTGGGSSDPDGSIVSWSWSTGDGSTKSGENITHVYQTAGAYRAVLTVTDNQGATARDTAVVTITQVGPPNQPPTARISAPATGAPNTSITFSGTQSTDTDGTIVSYAWTFGDGSTGSGASASHTYTAAGTYTASLTVTDNRGATNVAQHTIVIAATNPGLTPFIWQAAFGAIGTDSVVELTISLDLGTDIPETPGGEALQSYVVDSLKWNPALLRHRSFRFGAGQQQTIDHSDVPRGKLSFGGQTVAANSTGIITIARIQFTVIGGAGARAATQTFVGPLIGTASSGGFNYRPKTEIREAILTIP